MRDRNKYSITFVTECDIMILKQSNVCKVTAAEITKHTCLGKLT